MKKKSPKESFGIILLLDALGARTSSIEETEHYLRSLNFIHEDIEEFKTTIERLYINRLKRKEPAINLPTLKPRFFGDSILIATEVSDHKNLRHHFNAICHLANIILARGIEAKILFRGAIAIGSYVEDDLTILGPAITDAASWYEQGEFVGVIATPRTKYFIDCFETPEPEKDTPPEYILWDKTPIKPAGCLQTYVLNWPLAAAIHVKEPKENSISWLNRSFCRYQIPKNTENKYLQTLNFLIHAEKTNFPEK